MKRVTQLGWLVLVGGALLAFPACGDDDDSTSNAGGSSGHAGAGNGGAPDGAGGADAAAKCEALAELCHPVDDKDGPTHDCHVLAEAGDTENCLAEYDRCHSLCEAAYAHGEGGAGGTGAEHGHDEAGAAGQGGATAAAGTAGNAG
jgi:hypothetical protein